MPDSPRILIAEDHPLSRRLLAENLELSGYEVILASNGTEAMQILEAPASPRLALLDWRMPGADGLEVCRRVRAQTGRPYTYVIIITGTQEKAGVTAGLEAGADDYIVKPFDQQELLARVRVGQRMVKLERQLTDRIAELESTLADVKKLKRLLPICKHCKSIRDGEDYWQEIEEYISSETGSDFTHGICPDCLARVLQEEGCE